MLFPRFALSRFAAFLAFSFGAAALAQGPPVFTAEYDNGRTTANNLEFILNPSTVGGGNFGKVGSWDVDGQIIGQPLYVPFGFAGRQFPNVVYVATMHNTVYAFNADKPGSAPLWQVNLGPPVPVGYAGRCPADFATGGELGILGTPVIDFSRQALYLVAAHPVQNRREYTHTLYALDLLTGRPVQGGSAVIEASVDGTGSGSKNGRVEMNRTSMIQRPALLLSHDNVYIGFSGCGPDPSPYHGWVLGYSAGDIQKQTMSYNVTPNGDEGGIWQGGRGLVGGPDGSVFFEAGNGDWDGRTDFGESFVKLSPSGNVDDWFTPPDVARLSDLDLDLSTTSPLLTPDTNLLIGSGKQGLVYVLDAHAMGKGGNPAQSFTTHTLCYEPNGNCQRIHSLAYWQHSGPSTLYTWGVNDTLHAYSYDGRQFQPAPHGQGQDTAGYPGGILTVSSTLGYTPTGIVWALLPGVLRAYDANDVSHELWSSAWNSGRDGLAGSYHFEQFTVVGGRVYVPDSRNHLVVYGLLSK